MEYADRPLGVAAWYCNNNAPLLVVRVPVRDKCLLVCNNRRELLAKRLRGGRGDIALVVSSAAAMQIGPLFANQSANSEQ